MYVHFYLWSFHRTVKDHHVRSKAKTKSMFRLLMMAMMAMLMMAMMAMVMVMMGT